MAGCFTTEQRAHNMGHGMVGSSPQFELDVADLINGTGRWENMQEVIRSAIKVILDTQANYQRQLQKLQALVASSSKRLAKEKASREDLALTGARCGENASQLSKLGGDIGTATEDSRAEAIDLRARLEAKVSKEHLVACLEGKASQSELLELRGRLGRVCSEAGVVEMRGKQALRDKTLALEKRLEALEAGVRGCEAHAVRSDPAAVALRVETLASGLRDLGKRVDCKGDTVAMERVLQGKVDKQTLDAALSSKAERTDLARIEASAAALLALSRERAATTATLESNLGATAAETTALRERAADHDQALVTLKTGLAQRREACRDTFEQRARGLEKRVRRAEEGLAMVMAEIGARMAEVTRRCRDYGRAERKSVTKAVEALVRRVEGWDLSQRKPHTVIALKAIEDRISTLEGTVATAAATAAAAVVASKARNLTDRQPLPCDKQHLEQKNNRTLPSSTLSATSAVPVRQEEEPREKVQGAVSQGKKTTEEASPTGNSHRNELRLTVTSSVGESHVLKTSDGRGNEGRRNRSLQLRWQRRRADRERGEKVLDTTERHVEGRNRSHNSTRADGRAAAELAEDRAQCWSWSPDRSNNISPRRNHQNLAMTTRSHRRKQSGRTGGSRECGGQAEWTSHSPNRDISYLSPDRVKTGEERQKNREPQTLKCNESSGPQAQMKNESFRASSTPSSTSSIFPFSSCASTRAFSSCQHKCECRRRIKHGGARGKNCTPPSEAGGEGSSACAERVVRESEASLDKPELHERAEGATVMTTKRGLVAQKAQIGSRETEDNGNRRRTASRCRNCDYGQPSSSRMDAGVTVAGLREFADSGASEGLLKIPMALDQPQGRGIRGHDMFVGGHKRGSTSGTHSEDGESREVKESRYRSQKEKLSGKALENAHRRTCCDATASMHTQSNANPSPSSSASRSPARASSFVSLDSSDHLRQERVLATSKPTHCWDDHLEHPHPRGSRGGAKNVASSGDRRLLLLDGGVRKESGGASGDDESDPLGHRLEELRKEKEVFRSIVERGGT